MTPAPHAASRRLAASRVALSVHGVPTVRATFIEDALALTLPAIGCNVERRLAASFVLPMSCGKVRCVVVAHDFRATLLLYMGCG